MKNISEKFRDYFMKLLGLVVFGYLVYTVFNIFSFSLKWEFGWLFHHPEQPLWIKVLIALLELILLPLFFGGILWVIIKLMSLTGDFYRWIKSKLTAKT